MRWGDVGDCLALALEALPQDKWPHAAHARALGLRFVAEALSDAAPTVDSSNTRRGGGGGGGWRGEPGAG